MISTMPLKPLLHDQRKGLKALHTLSAYATQARLVLAQLSLPEKTNEITAIPELAETKQLEGALVSIDAMGCQVEIADKIVAHKADYLLALKGNQPTFEAEVEDYFADSPASELVTKTTVEKGHGRIETRFYTASTNVDWIVSARSYPGQPRFKSIKTSSRSTPAPNTPVAAPSRPVTIAPLPAGLPAAGPSTRSLTEYSQIAEPRGIEFSSVFASIPAMESSTLDGGFLGIEFSSESMIANTRTGS
jgi:predicted transposase YbfD/YdcC